LHLLAAAELDLVRSMKRRYIGLALGVALPIILHLVVALLDEAEISSWPLVALVYTEFIGYSPAILLPFHGLFGAIFVLLFWGAVGFAGGVFIESRRASHKSRREPMEALPDAAADA
jgi:hypothetical protein